MRALERLLFNIHKIIAMGNMGWPRFYHHSISTRVTKGSGIQFR
jgi:hypothetical protein